MTVVGWCCLCSFGNSFVYSGTLGIVEWAWETYHLCLPCLLSCPLLPPHPQAPWLDNGLQGMFSFHSHLSSNLNIPITLVRTRIRLCVACDSWRPRLCIGLLRVGSASSHWSVGCWLNQFIIPPTSLPTHCLQPQVCILPLSPSAGDKLDFALLVLLGDLDFASVFWE